MHDVLPDCKMQSDCVLATATHTLPPVQPWVEGAPLKEHTNACVDPLGGSVLAGVPVHVPPVAPGVLVTWT
jgi:hypothetical protein